MLSKQRQKYIQSLQLKKYRQEYQAFLVEGAKSVSELLDSDFEIELVCCTTKFLSENAQKLRKISELEEISQSELEKLGTLQSNDSALAVVKMKENKAILLEKDEFALVLDDIRDPGNLGTIIRIADWYGIKKIICSNTTVEFYNPKVIISTMGSFTRIQLFYTDLTEYLQKITIPIIGTFLDSQNIHQFQFPKSGIIVLGNESKGISEEIEKLVTAKVTIPKFGNAESLNAGIATAVVLDNLRRNSEF